MRLTGYEIESIRTAAQSRFGTGVEVYPFGSRTVDSEKGGDIDLLIKDESQTGMNARIKIDFITDLIFLIGEQKIDVILDHQNAPDSTFLNSIRNKSIRLC